MTASSFLPAATQMIYDMGLQHLLQGVTFECPPAALAEKQKVVRCVLSLINAQSCARSTDIYALLLPEAFPGQVVRLGIWTSTGGLANEQAILPTPARNDSQ